MAEKKTILEEALLDIKNIQSALNANTKEILRSVAREEIDSVVKESLTKEAFEEEDLETTEEPTDSVETPAVDFEGGDEESLEGDVATDIQGSEEVEPEMGPEMGMDALALDGDEELDMTAASDDEVIAIYKKLSGEDEIEIVGDEIHLTVSEPGEYIVKTSGLNGSTETPSDFTDVEDEMGVDGDVDYEIEMDDEDGETSDFAPVDDEEETTEPMGDTEVDDEEETETIDEKIAVGTGMSVGTHRNPSGPASIGAQENPKSKLDENLAAKKLISETAKKYNTLLTESKKLKVENEEFRKALKEFRNKLVETVVFNSNLTYVTKLFIEHATTKSEKQNIIKRFDEEVTTLKESKKLYKTIANELDTRKPITESIENKIIKEVSTGSSKQLNESTAYVDPSTKRILDLIQRVEKK